MKKSLIMWQIAGFVFTGILGVLLHFLFDWTGGSVIAAPISAVNESTWEHMKLIFLPMFVFTLIELPYKGREFSGFLPIKLLGTLLGTISVPVIFYTLTGVFGETPDWVNIGIFYAAAAIGYIAETALLLKGVRCKSTFAAVLIFVVITLLFGIFTFNPPKIPLFQDPVTKTYGYFETIV